MKTKVNMQLVRNEKQSDTHQQRSCRSTGWTSLASRGLLRRLSVRFCPRYGHMSA